MKIKQILVIIACAVTMYGGLHGMTDAQTNPVDALPVEMKLTFPADYNFGNTRAAFPNPEIVDIDQIEINTPPQFAAPGTIREAIRKQYLKGCEFILARVMSTDIFGEKPYHIHYFDAGAHDSSGLGTIELLQYRIKDLKVIDEIYFFILNPSDKNPSFKYFCSWSELASPVANNYRYLFNLYYGKPDLEALKYLNSTMTLDAYTRALVDCLLGKQLIEINNFEQAKMFFDRAAAQRVNGYAYYVAIGFLAIMYYRGHHVFQDYEKAFKYFQKTAMQNEFLSLRAEARFNLGLMYYKGYGVAQDSSTAMQYFIEVSHQYDNQFSRAGALYQLGLMYMNGSGVEQDMLKARAFFRSVLHIDKGEWNTRANKRLHEIDKQLRLPKSKRRKMGEDSL